MVAILHFCSFIVDILLIIYVIGKGPDMRVNRLCALLISAFAIWSLSYGLANLAHSEQEALLFFNIAAVGICSFPSIGLWFYFTVTNKHSFRYQTVLALLSIAIPIFYVDN